jgi:flagellar basal-body rod protein FlgB
MLNDMPLMSFIREKMKWHQARQSVLASNVANADTVGYKPKDLTELTFDQHLPKVNRPQKVMMTTHAKHIDVNFASDGFDRSSGKDFEVTPSGNAVVLEDQMVKVANNQFDYQMATTVYSRSLGLIKIALGRS